MDTESEDTSYFEDSGLGDSDTAQTLVQLENSTFENTESSTSATSAATPSLDGSNTIMSGGIHSRDRPSILELRDHTLLTPLDESDHNWEVKKNSAGSNPSIGNYRVVTARQIDTDPRTATSSNSCITAGQSFRPDLRSKLILR